MTSSSYIKDRAIVIHLSRYSETSLLLTLFTENHGLVKCLAKGGARKKNSSSFVPDLFMRGEVLVRLSRSGGLDSLNEFHFETKPMDLMKDFVKLELLGYFSKIVISHLEIHSPESELYSILDKALDYLEKNPASVKLLERFEWRTCEILGLPTSPDPFKYLSDHHPQLLDFRNKVISRFE